MDNWSKFVERLNELIVERNLNCSSFAKAINKTSGTTSKYMLGHRFPSLAVLVTYADYFNVSIDYLLGLKDDSPYKNFLPPQPLNRRVEFLLKETGCSKYALIKGSGVKESRFYAWMRGQNNPSVDNVIKMAAFFGVEIDYFIGRII